MMISCKVYRYDFRKEPKTSYSHELHPCVEKDLDRWKPAREDSRRYGRKRMKPRCSKILPSTTRFDGLVV